MIKQQQKAAFWEASSRCSASNPPLADTSKLQHAAPGERSSLLPSEAPHSAQFGALPDCAFVRLPCLVSLFACSPATIWRWVKASKIPAPKKLGSRISAWNVGEIRQALSARMKGDLV